MARKQRDSVNTSAWLNTYADLVTLLLCFWVLLYSLSIVDTEKWERLAEALRGSPQLEEMLANSQPAIEAFNDSVPVDFDELYEYIVSYTQERGMESSVNVYKGQDSVYIRFSNNIFFMPDSAKIKQDSHAVLEFLGDCLKSVEDQVLLININGHTASVEYENYPVSAWTLSGERATNIAIYLEERKDIDPKQLRPIGYADNFPVAPNNTEEGRRENRRVDMVIVSKSAEAAMGGEIYNRFAGLFDPADFPEAGVSGVLTPENEVPIFE